MFLCSLFRKLNLLRLNIIQILCCFWEGFMSRHHWLFIYLFRALHGTLLIQRNLRLAKNNLRLLLMRSWFGGFKRSLCFGHIIFWLYTLIFYRTFLINWIYLYIRLDRRWLCTLKWLPAFQFLLSAALGFWLLLFSCRRLLHIILHLLLRCIFRVILRLVLLYICLFQIHMSFCNWLDCFLSRLWRYGV